MSNFKTIDKAAPAVKAIFNLYTKIGRDEISRTLTRIGIKSHDDDFHIGPDMDSDTIGAISTAIAAYTQFLTEKELYRDAIVVDCPDEADNQIEFDCDDTDSSIESERVKPYLDSIYAVIESLQDIDRTKKRMEWLCFYGEIPYGAYNLHSLASTLVEHLLVAKELSSQFKFTFEPQEEFFTKNLSDEEMATIAEKEKPRIPFYSQQVKHDGIYLARVYRVSMYKSKYLYFGYEIESNGTLSNFSFVPKDIVQEDANIQTGLKALGFVKNPPKDGEKYTEDEIRKIFDDVKSALDKTNSRVYILATPDSRFPSNLRYIPDLEHCEALFNTPKQHGICINEFQSESERDDIARKLSDFMIFAKNNALGLTYRKAKNEFQSAPCVTQIRENFFSLSSFEKAKESLAFMAKHRPGCYTLFDIANICGCYRCTSPNGGFWGCVSDCKFDQDFTTEYELAKHSL